MVATDAEVTGITQCRTVNLRLRAFVDETAWASRLNSLPQQLTCGNIKNRLQWTRTSSFEKWLFHVLWFYIQSISVPKETYSLYRVAYRKPAMRVHDMPESHDQQTDDASTPRLEKTNPAKRLHSIIEVAQRQNNGIATLDAWAGALGVDSGAAHANPHEVIDRIRLITEEVSILRRLMKKTHFSNDLYEPALANVTKLLAVSNLAAGWSSYVGAVTVADMLALRWCSEVIESESALTHEELQSLLDAVNELKERVEAEDLPDNVREFVLHQIELMIRGIHQYPIIGRRAARDAVLKAAGEFMDVHDSVAGTPPSYWARMGNLWQTLLATVEGSEKMVKAVSGIAENMPKIKEAISTAANLIR